MEMAKVAADLSTAAAVALVVIAFVCGVNVTLLWLIISLLFAAMLARARTQR